MDINKNPNLVVGDVLTHILVSQKRAWLQFSSFFCCMSERWKPSVAVMHQSTFTLREDLRSQGRSNGGDIRRGHPVFSVSCLGFLPGGCWLVCLSQGTPTTATTLDFVTTAIGQITLSSHLFSPWPGGLLVVKKMSESNEQLVGWLVGKDGFKGGLD